uniref:Uncharacterized protein n=1 Tax=Timema poppense TaxID=170557 RepID=A0A7R9D0D1_TIMPO|nr:unnamed protein product [Timema poppensis]
MTMSRVSKDMGAESLMAGAGILSRSADEFDNDPSVEAMWAIKAMEHAEVYFNYPEELFLMFYWGVSPDFVLRNCRGISIKS